MSKFLSHLENACQDFGVILSSEQLSYFETYAATLTDWNTRMNLTAILDPIQMADKHFADSIAVLHAFSAQKNLKLIDIGTGAGFPGIPLKIMRPDLTLTLLDSLQKRLTFLQSLCATLGISAAYVHGRAEEVSRQEAHREQYDIATARAVSDLPVLCEYCLPFVRVGGYFLAMKGPSYQDELARSESALAQLGGELTDVYQYTLSEGGERAVLCIKKIHEIHSKYPRHASKIVKSPL